MQKEILQFIKHSNYIESEYSQEALDDALIAWLYAFKHKDNLNLKVVLGIHQRLLKRVRPDIAGKIRTCDVWIGGRCKHFVSENLIIDELRIVLDNMKNGLENFKTKEQCAKACHLLFEDIHPFEDGNGRIGRIIMNIHRLNIGLPIKVIRGWGVEDNEHHSEQKNYYKWFK